MKYSQLVSMPSAVSDWLEEQLEARGIDSEVYTRYILSLLHAHTLDFIYPEEETVSQLKKDGSRRIRRSYGAYRWRHAADAKAEQIKRSAAVKCLMSAAEENCEVESLVDELCEKLKEVNSEPESSLVKSSHNLENKEPKKNRKISPKELAERYYAAFPPLNQKENSYLTSNINLVTSKWPSPDKKLSNIDLIAAKWTASGSPKKARKKTPKRHQNHCEINMKSSSRPHMQNRNRFGYRKTQCVRNLTREIADNMANWEFVYNNNNCKIKDQCLNPVIPTMAGVLHADSDINMYDADENELPIQMVKDLLIRNEEENNNRFFVSKLKLQNKEKQWYPPVYPSSIWSDDEKSDLWSRNGQGPPNLGTQETGKEKDANNDHQDWPVIGEKSAIPQEYQRSFDEEESAIKMEYQFPNVKELEQMKLDDQLSKVLEEQVLHILNVWSADSADSAAQNNKNSEDELLNFTLQNETNSLIETITDRVSPSVTESSFSLPPFVLSGNVEEDSMESFRDNECLFDFQTMSLLKLNHSKNQSAFSEYSRTSALQFNRTSHAFTHPFSRPFGRPIKGPNMPPKVVPTPQVAPQEEIWGSPQVYFRPIKTPPIKEEEEKKYQDGATFAIKGTLDKVDFQRSASGTLFLENEFGERKRYHEYVWQNLGEDSLFTTPKACRPSSNELQLKVWLAHTDKASQTEETGDWGQNIEDSMEEIMDVVDSGKETEVIEKELLDNCKQCGVEKVSKGVGTYKLADRPLGRGGTVWWQPSTDCKRCSDVWGHKWSNCAVRNHRTGWDDQLLKDIWGGAEICDCQACLPFNLIIPPLSDTTTRLREEMKEEAEGLLSILSNVQRAYNDSSRIVDAQLKNEEGSGERKRRHSHMDGDSEIWSFASRLQEDCLINLSTLPTLRSVTL